MKDFPGTLRIAVWWWSVSAVALLTTFGLIAGLPLLFRGPRLGAMAVGLLVGVVLLWLPPSLRHFKAQAAAARAQRKAARKASRLPG